MQVAIYLVRMHASGRSTVPYVKSVQKESDQNGERIKTLMEECKTSKYADKTYKEIQ